jgi:tetratricopeptide (TPR) repeat protein
MAKSTSRTKKAKKQPAGGAPAAQRDAAADSAATAARKQDDATPGAIASAAAIAGMRDARPSSPRSALFPGLLLVVFLGLWFAPHVDFDEPWNEGMTLVNASRKAASPAERKSMLDRAGALLKEQVRLHPYHARLHFFLGYYYDDAGEYDKAIAEAKEAIRLGAGSTFNPVEPKAREQLVHASVKRVEPLIAAKDYAGARRILDESFAVYPSSKQLLTALANLDLREQAWDAARARFEKLAELDPKDDETWYILGHVAASQKRPADAIAFLEKSLALNPARAAARELLERLKNQ